MCDMMKRKKQYIDYRLLFVIASVLVMTFVCSANTLGADLSAASIENIPDVVYTGQYYNPSPAVTVNGQNLTEGKDYILSWSQNVNAGTATVTFTGRGNYTGKVYRTFEIQPASMAYTEITNIRDKVYNGNQQYQSPTIYYYGKKLKHNTDYTLSYRNNIQLGTAAVIITGIGNFRDSVTRTFSIMDPNPGSSTAGAIFTFNEQEMYCETFNVNEKIVIGGAIGTSSPMNPIHYLYIRVKKGGSKIWYAYKYFEDPITPTVYLITDFTPTEAGDYLIELDYSEEFQEEGNFFRVATKTLNVGNTRKDIAKAAVSGIEDKEYTGNSITQSPVVKMDGKTLVEGYDYYVNYYSNVNVGQASFNVYGIGNYRGMVEQETTFMITPRNLSSEMITLSPDEFTYNGYLQKPDITVKNGDFLLREGTDYTITENAGGTEPGSYSVLVSAADNGNYTGSTEKYYSINGISIADAAVSVTPDTYIYDGTEKKPDVTVMLDGNEFPDDKYSVKYSNNINAGTAVVVVTATDSHFTGSAQTTFSIGKLDISSSGISVAAPDSVTYNRSVYTPVPAVIRNGKRLENNTDFKLSYTGNVNVGTAVVTITGNGNYSGSRTTSFEIARKNISDASVTVDIIPDQTLTEVSAVTPSVTVKDGAALLTSDEIAVVYKDNDKAGTATVTITGIGNYIGTREISFRIIVKTETTDDPAGNFSGNPAGSSSGNPAGNSSGNPTGDPSNNLLEEVARLEKEDISHYSKEDRKAIQAAINNAKAVLGNSMASESDRAKALNTLVTAKKAADDNAVGTLSGSKTGETAVPSASAQENTILSLKSDSDPKGSTYGLLQARMKKVTKNSITLKWKKIKGAKYTIYGNKCGKKNRYKKLKTVSGTTYTQKKLKKGTYYKYLIVAVKDGKAIATSKTIHVATTGGKVGNDKSVKVKKKSLSVKIGKTVKIKASTKSASKKLKVKKHRKIAFESSNTNIATVTSEGVVKGVRAGTCYVYAYAQDGVMAKAKITVA